ncbi:unnamed protein product [Calypogeia fissa]
MAGKGITALNGRMCPLAFGFATLQLDQRGDPKLTKDFIVGGDTGCAIAIAIADPSSFVTFSTAGFLNGAAAFGPNGMFVIDNLGGLRIFFSSVLTRTWSYSLCVSGLPSAWTHKLTAYSSSSGQWPTLYVGKDNLSGFDGQLPTSCSTFKLET